MRRNSRNVVLVLLVLLGAVRPLHAQAPVTGVFQSCTAPATACLVIRGNARRSGSVIDADGNVGWDAGPITVSFNGMSETVPYGQYSTPASIVADIAAKFAWDYAPVLYAKAYGSPYVSGSPLFSIFQPDSVVEFVLKSGDSFTPVTLTGLDPSVNDFYAELSQLAGGEYQPFWPPPLSGGSTINNSFGPLATTTTVGATPQDVVLGGTVNLSAQVTGTMPPSGSIFFQDTFNGSTATLATVPAAAQNTTNLLDDSNSLSNWSAQGLVGSMSSGADAPDGTPTGLAFNYIGNTNASFAMNQLVNDPLLASLGLAYDFTVPYTFSVWLRAPSPATVSLGLGDGVTPSTSQPINVTSSWQRYSFTSYLPSSTTSIQLSIRDVGSTSGAQEAIALWGAQLEPTPPGPYVPTSSVATQASVTNLLVYAAQGTAGYLEAGPGWDTNLNEFLSGDAYLYGASTPAPDGSLTTTQLIFNDGRQASFSEWATVDSSKQYIFSLWVQGAVNMNESFLSLSCGYNPPVARMNFTAPSVWTRIDLATGPLPAGCTQMLVSIGGDAVAVFDGPDDTQNDYQDGGISDGGGYLVWGTQLEEQTASAAPGPFVSTGALPGAATTTNLLPWSESPTGWSIAGSATLTPNSDIDPTGSNNAITVSTSGSYTLTQSGGTPDTGSPYTFSIWIFSPSGTATAALKLSDQTGQIVASGQSFTPNAFWTRYSFTGYLPSGVTTVKAVMQGNGTVEIWGAQLEKIHPGIYIPTSGSPASGTGATASFSTTALGSGTHYITASYSGDNFSQPSTSASASVNVAAAGQPALVPTAFVSFNCAPLVIPVGGLTSCTLHVLPNAGGALALIYLRSDGSQAGFNVPIVNGQAVVGDILSEMGPGVYTIFAAYSGDANYAATDDLTAQVTVVQGGPGSGMLSDPQSLLYGFAINSYDYAGNVTGYTDTVNGTWSASYDNLNRLTGAFFTAPGASTMHSMNWNYDPWGNRLSQTIDTGGFQTSTMSPGSNRIASSSWSNAGSSGTAAFTYDAVGNVTGDGQNIYMYDVEGHLCASQPAIGGVVTQYIYDAEGNRTSKGSTGSTQIACLNAVSINDFIPTTTYLANQEYSFESYWYPTILVRTYVPGAVIDADGTIHYQLSDWLGNRRMQVSAAGVVEGTYANLPFGDGLAINGDASVPKHFTGKERDTETSTANGHDGLDYFGARYDSSNIGRWTQPDFANGSPIPFAEMDMPQSFDLYTYVGNNPLSGIDPDGHASADAACISELTSPDHMVDGPGCHQALSPDSKDQYDNTHQGKSFNSMRSMEEGRHDTTLATGVDPLIGVEFEVQKTGNIENDQRAAMAIEAGMASCGGCNVAQELALIYSIFSGAQVDHNVGNSLPDGTKDGMVGGHYNWTQASVRAAGDTEHGCPGGRCGLINNNHYDHGDVHNDTANPFFDPIIPIGGLIHFFRDQIGGHHWLKNGMEPW